MDTLAALEARLRDDLSLLELPPKNWIPHRTADGREVLDVAIIGGGMSGLTASAAMILLGIRNIAIFDKAPAGQEGPWVTYARMTTLRSPKILTGPALGLPALTFRAYYQARFGNDAWAELGKIPRPLWMDYLIWYRRVLDLPVRNNTRLTGVRPFGPDLLELCFSDQEPVLTRRLVLATGRDGLGGPSVPAIARTIEKRFWAHSAEDIDFAALEGRAVGVIGAGSSAMDNAATALEAGAASVDLFIRRKDIPRINKMTGIGSPGLVHGFQALPDETRWRFLTYSMREQIPPPRNSTLRVSSQGGRFHLASPILHLRQDGDSIQLTTPKATYRLDFLIFATGFGVDPAQRPEFSAFLPYVRRWADRFTPPDDLRNAELSSLPDLGPAYEFQEKTPSTCPMLARIHGFNDHAILSHGKLSGDIPAISQGAQRLAQALAGLFYAEDQSAHYASLQAFDTPELQGDEWTDADAEPALTEA